MKKFWDDKIDAIFVINLVKREDRRKHILTEFREHNIRFMFIPAQEHENGEVGLKMTFAAIFDLAKERGYERVLVFEDDAQVLVPDVTSHIKNALAELPEDFLTLQLGANLLMPPIPHSDNLLKVRASYAAHAQLYSKEAMEILFPVLGEELAFDVLIAKYIQPLNRSYCTRKMLVTQKPFTSDIASFEQYSKNPQAFPYLDFENKTILWNKMMEERFLKFTQNI